MQYTPNQLKQKLSEGLDDDNNVVNMGRVLEVISILEKYPITREALEETRIGKAVNEMRRKTSDQQLAKRAKKLVRSWQKVVSSTSETNTSVNGEGVAGGGRPQGIVKKPVSPAVAQGIHVNRPVNPNSVNSSLSPRKPNSKPTTPQLQNVKHLAVTDSVKRSVSSPQLAPGSAKRFCISPNSRPNTPLSPDSVSSQTSRKSAQEESSRTKRPVTPSSSSVASSGISLSRSTTPSNVISDPQNLKRTLSSDNLQKAKISIQSVHSTGDLSPAVKSTTNGEQNGVVKRSRVKQNAYAKAIEAAKALEAAGLSTEVKFKPVVNGAETAPVLEPTPKRKRGRPRKHKLEPSPEETNKKSVTLSKNASSSALSKSFSEKRNVSLGLKTEFDSLSRDKFVSLTPKVKSTAELIHSLQAKNSLSVSKDTARQIEANLIQKEHDEEKQSVVPSSVKPRPRRKPGVRGELIPPSTPVSLKTKTEMVEKFLETSVNQTPDDLSPIKYELPRTESPSASTSLEDITEPHEASNLPSQRNLVSPSGSATEQIKSKSVMTDEVKCDSSDKGKSELEEDKPLSLEEIYSKYPPLDLDNFVFDKDEYEMPEPLEINDSVVSRIHGEHWTGVNGVFDSSGGWRDWTQTLSLDSYQGDMVHVLPYVIVDD